MRAMGLIALACAATWQPASAPCAEAEAEAGQAAESSAAVAKPLFTPPAILSKPNLMHPAQREALVFVRLLISPEGKPTQVEVLEERGFHDAAYRKLALQFVQGMRYQPATINGIPVEYGPTVQTLKFGMDLPAAQQGITYEFRYELNKVEKLLRNGDFAGANHHAEWMLREKVRLNYEFAVLQAELGRTHAAAGHDAEALAAIKLATERATTENPGFKLRAPPPPNDPSKYLLPKDLIISLLDLRMRLLARQGELLGALKTYNEMAGLAAIRPEDPRAVLAEKIASLLEGTTALVFPARVSKEYWPHELVRPHFTVRNVKGELGIIHLHCRGRYVEHNYAPGSDWSVPDGWEDCVVEFYGEPGTTFELVELPAV
jgi:hypothetical protein